MKRPSLCGQCLGPGRESEGKVSEGVVGRGATDPRECGWAQRNGGRIVVGAERSRKEVESRDDCDYAAVEVDSLNGCDSCYFYTGVVGVCDGLPCCSVNRKDNLNVIFKKL